MDHHSFLYHHPLAQMPTDQREYEQHRVLVQTELSGAQGFFQVTASDSGPQPYHPGPPVQNWPAFRSNLAPQALMPLHTGFSNPWGAKLHPYDFGTSSVTRAMVPDETCLASLYTASHANINMPPTVTSSSNIHHQNSQANMPSTIALSSNFPQQSSHAPRGDDHDDLMIQQTTPATSSFLSQERFNHSASHPGIPTSERSRRWMHATPQSPPISVSSTQSPRHPHSLVSMSPAPTVSGAEGSSPRISIEDASDQEQNGEPPYSRLIWDALMSTEDKMLPLQGIYQWFEKNTTKAGNEESKGWQNSIRHNLSMNAGFEPVKVEASGKKAMNYWRLTEEAIRNGGVQSTTRYRKMSGKKAMSSDPPDPRRQRPGAKGGKKCAGVKRHAVDYEDGEPSHPRSVLHQRNVRPNRSPPFNPQSQIQVQAQPQPQPQPPNLMNTDIHHLQHYSIPYSPTPSIGLPQYDVPHMPNALPELQPSGLPPMPRHNWQHFDLSSVIGTTNSSPNDNMVFCDTAEGAPDCAAFVGPWVGLV